jgi:sugar phosphate permease
VSGKLSDRMARRKPLVLLGYGISGAARPLIGFASGWLSVLGPRLLDRVGKGIRSSPRDALIADVTAPGERGRAYGLHRALDNAGAFVGPLVAFGLLGLGLGLRQVIWAAAVPAGIVMLVLVFGVREQPRVSTTPAAGTPVANAPGSTPEFTRFLVTVGVFTLGSGTDAFLLLRLSQVFATEHVALIWGLHNLIRSVAVYYGGSLADRFDRRVLLRTGWLMHAAAFALLALPLSAGPLLATSLGYALHRGFTEPCERALVADYAAAGRRGWAFGWYHAVVGLLALPSSLLLGALWQAEGAALALLTGAGVGVLAVLLNIALVRRPGAAIMP